MILPRLKSWASCFYICRLLMRSYTNSTSVLRLGVSHRDVLTIIIPHFARVVKYISLAKARATCLQSLYPILPVLSVKYISLAKARFTGVGPNAKAMGLLRESLQKTVQKKCHLFDAPQSTSESVRQVSRNPLTLLSRLVLPAASILMLNEKRFVLFFYRFFSLLR